MAKLAVVGQERSELIDCSEVIPRPKTLCDERRPSAIYPPGECANEVQKTCNEPLPLLLESREYLLYGFMLLRLIDYVLR